MDVLDEDDEDHEDHNEDDDDDDTAATDLQGDVDVLVRHGARHPRLWKEINSAGILKKSSQVQVEDITRWPLNGL